jgi:hypothetical protein
MLVFSPKNWVLSAHYRHSRGWPELQEKNPDAASEVAIMGPLWL